MSEAEQVVAGLLGRGLTLAAAESLTGGLLAAAVVDVPGASKVFRGGVIAYATEIKHDLLGVDAALLREHGPVHPDVALMMAGGVRERCGADVGVATTGVAGPDPQGQNLPGEVYVAVVMAGRHEVRGLRLDGDRASVRRGAVLAALSLIIDAADFGSAESGPYQPGT
jgi:nicotinamide-nucleotide amidase